MKRVSSGKRLSDGEGRGGCLPGERVGLPLVPLLLLVVLGQGQGQGQGEGEGEEGVEWGRCLEELWVFREGKDVKRSLRGWGQCQGRCLLTSSKGPLMRAR